MPFSEFLLLNSSWEHFRSLVTQNHAIRLLYSVTLDDGDTRIGVPLPKDQENFVLSSEGNHYDVSYQRVKKWLVIEGRFEYPQLARGSIVDLVLKGGGAKGIAYSGAVGVLQRWYNIRTYAGTSAGAIAASLFAVGASGGRVHEAIRAPLRILRGGANEDAIGSSDLLQLFRGNAMFGTATFRKWFNAQIKEFVPNQQFKNNGEPTFAQLAPFLHANLIIFAADSKRGLRAFGVMKTPSGIFRPLPECEHICVADAVAASMAIPAVFSGIPSMSTSYADGGLLANFPIVETEELLVQNEALPSIVGLCVETQGETISESFTLEQQLKNALSAITDGQGSSDKERLRHNKRLITINVGRIDTLDLHLDRQTADALKESAELSAVDYVMTVSGGATKETALFEGDNSKDWTSLAQDIGSRREKLKPLLEAETVVGKRPQIVSLFLLAAARHFAIWILIGLVVAVGGTVVFCRFFCR